jgi:hypothetical protein
MNGKALLLALSLAALPAVAETRGSVSESFTGGSGPFVGNSIAAGVSPGIVDLDVGYDFGSDTDFALYHEIWGSVGVWPGGGVRLSIDGSFGPRTSSTSPDRGYFSLGSAGVGGTVSFHPGRSGEVRPYLEIGASYDRFDVSEAAPSSLSNVVNVSFSQTGLRGTAGIDVKDTSLRFGGTKYWNGEDAGAVNLPPGVGGGPSGIGAISGALPTRAEDWYVRASVRQAFGGYRDWDVQLTGSHGSYVDGDGDITAVNLRLGHRFSRVVRAHLGVTGQVESFSPALGGNTRTSAFVNVGITLVF